VESIAKVGRILTLFVSLFLEIGSSFKGSLKPMLCSSAEGRALKTLQCANETMQSCKGVYLFFLQFMGHLLACTRNMEFDLRGMETSVSDCMHRHDML
jgi:hypothetical protein